MLSIIGKKQETWKDLKLDEVAMSLDDLTEQILLANKMNAAAILRQQGVIGPEEYCGFLMDIYER